MSCTRSYNPLCVSTFNPTPMANNYQGSTFPTPPSLRARSVRPVSLISARNDKDYALESSPLHLGRSNSQRSSGTHDLATQSDIRRVLEYLMHMRQDLDAEKRKREEDVSALRNQSQEMYDGFTATSRRQHERASAFKTLMQDHTRKVEKLQNRASALDTSMEEVQLQMQEVAKQVQSDKLRKMMNVMPLGSHAGENVWTAQCIFVCNAARPNVFEMDGVAYLKLQHSRPAQKVTFTGDSEHDFIHTVERSFAALLKDRSWMPLAAYRVGAYAQARVTLDRLTAKDREAGTWTRQFLDEHCVVLDSKGRAHIYLALQNALLTLAEVRDLATADAASAGKHQTQQQAPPRSTNGTSGPSSPAAIGSPYATNNSFSPPQSTLTSSRTSIEGNVPPVPTLVKRPAPPANHAVIRQPLNATYKPNALSALSTAVNSPQVSHEMEVDAKQLSPAADTAVIGRIDYAADGHVHKTQNADLSATALSKAISSPSASVSSSPTLTSSSTASVLSSGPSRKEVSLRQRLFKGSKPKTPMATPKSSYEALSFVEQSPRLVQKPRPQLDMQTKPKQASMNDDIRSSKSSSLDLSLFQERPQLVQKPKPAVDTQTTRKQPSATEYPHSPLRIQGRPKSPHPSTKATPSLHARRPSTQSKRTTRSAASKFSKTSKPRPRSQSRSRASSTSRQNDAADGPHDWAYQLKEATASKESLRLKKAQEEERKLYMQKLGMRNVKVVKGGFWRRAFGGK